MEDLPIKSLNSGLGFHEFTPSNKTPHLPTKNSQKTRLPDFLLEDKWDFEDINTYQKILSNLEKPWLGNIQNQLNDENKTTGTTLKTKSLAQEKSLAVKVTDHNQQQNKHTHSVTQNYQSTESLNNITPTSIFCLKSIIVDVVMAGILFFPCLLLFVFLSEPKPLLILANVKWLVFFAFLLFSQIYCLLCRLFCSETYGEMLSGRKLCKAMTNKTIIEKSNISSITEVTVHPGLLFWRFLVSCVTGVILLPILSLCFKKDFLGKLTYLRFYKTPLQTK